MLQNTQTRAAAYTLSKPMLRVVELRESLFQTEKKVLFRSFSVAVLTTHGFAPDSGGERQDV